MTQDDHVSLSTTQFAARHGCTSEIVRRWCIQGMDGSARDGRNYRITDPAAAEAWMRRKGKKSSLHGGKRVRAGRKKAGFRDAQAGGSGSSENAHRFGSSEKAHGLGSVGLGNHAPPTTRPYYERQLDEVNLELASERARKERIANDERLGRLIPHEQFEALLSAVCAGVRTRLESFPSMIAGEIVRELDLGAEAEPRVREALERGVRRVVAVIKADPRGEMAERDPELWERLVGEEAAA
ncbi:MAG: hypothetical protein AAGF47_07030 [Planctomycetota bacterium]